MCHRAKELAIQATNLIGALILFDPSAVSLPPSLLSLSLCFPVT